MKDESSARAALIKLPLTDGTADPLAVHRGLLALARRGTIAPETLDLFEIKQVCYALEVHYAQLGLSQ